MRRPCLLPLLLGLIGTFVLGSCENSSAIQRVSESKSHFQSAPVIMSHDFPARDVYRVYQRAATGFVPINSVREAAEERAEAFARGHGRHMVVLGDKVASPPYILGNFPRVELIFALTGKR